MRTTDSIELFDHQPQSIENWGILITGGTTGIGRAIAIQLAASGARTLICGRHKSTMNDALSDIKKYSDQSAGVVVDLATKGGITKLISRADKFLPNLDAVVLNAALPADAVDAMTFDEIDYLIRTNVTAYLALTREALIRMKKQKSGHIVLIGSMSADTLNPGSNVYTASKSAIQGFATSLRRDAFEQGVKVTLIEPGAVGADMQPKKKTHAKKAEQKKMLKAEDIASLVQYVLTQPPRCDIVSVSIRPHKQEA